jgi:plastocyanin
LLHSKGFLHRSGAGPLLTLAGVLICIPAALVLAAPSPASAATHTLSIGDGAFVPSALTVNVGDTVTWTNEDDSPHTVTSGGPFDSGNLDPGQSFSFTFTDPGTYGYACRYHDDMVGTVTVIAAVASAAPAPTEVVGTAHGRADAEALAQDGTHDDGSQPDTALVRPSARGAQGWLAPVLTGLGLLALAAAVIPAAAPFGAQPASPRRSPRPGGWRR